MDVGLDGDRGWAHCVRGPVLEDVGEAALEGARAKGLDGLLGDCLGLNVWGVVDVVVGDNSDVELDTHRCFSHGGQEISQDNCGIGEGSSFGS